MAGLGTHNANQYIRHSLLISTPPPAVDFSTPLCFTHTHADV